MHSLKLKLINLPDLENYFSEFGKLKRLCYNRLSEGKSWTETSQWIKKNITTDLDGCFIEFACSEANNTFLSQKELGIKKIIFGGKKNFKNLSEGKIAKEEWLQKRNPSLSTIGRAADLQGNRKFKLDIQNNKFFFCPNRNTSIPLEFVSNKKTHDFLLKVEGLAKSGKMPITYRLTRTHIILSLDETRLVEPKFESIKDRILAIDLNPNYIGISISDFKNGQKEVFSQVFDLRKLNKCSTDKKKYEQLQISNRIIKLCKHYRVETLGVEKLEVQSKDHAKGKKFNGLINQWDRNTLINNLRKHCGLEGIRFQEVAPQYSSFVGCLSYPDKIDSIAASLELARRCNLFQKVYKEKVLPKNTSIVFPEWNEYLMNRWKEDLGTKVISGWKYAYNWFKKNPKLCYRVLFSDNIREVFRFKSRKTNVFLCFD